MEEGGETTHRESPPAKTAALHSPPTPNQTVAAVESTHTEICLLGLVPDWCYSFADVSRWKGGELTKMQTDGWQHVFSSCAILYAICCEIPPASCCSSSPISKYLNQPKYWNRLQQPPRIQVPYTYSSMFNVNVLLQGCSAGGSCLLWLQDQHRKGWVRLKKDWRCFCFFWPENFYRRADPMAAQWKPAWQADKICQDWWRGAHHQSEWIKLDLPSHIFTFSLPGTKE